MRKIFLAAVLGLATLPSQVRAQIPPQDLLAPAENAFAVDLYGKLSQVPGNVFFSPYSVATALEMVYAGAKGSTADEIADTLHLNLLAGSGNRVDSQAALLSAAAEQQGLTKNPTGGFTFQATNALWGDKSYTFKPDFIANIKASFGGDLEPVNFKEPERASAKINKWVAQETQNKIQNLVSPDMLLNDPPMVLTDAVYFNSVWLDKFDPSATKQTKFYVSAGQNVMTEMMNMSVSLALTQADGVKILSIPYGDRLTSMVIILPDDPQGLSAVEASLSVKKLNTWLAESQDVPVILSMPKFQTDSRFDLKKTLTSLGIDTAFNASKADFTGIADDPSRPLYLGDVVHKAYVEVDEQGTEAAAATAVVQVASGGFEGPQPPPPPPVRFIADHPFIYLIRSAYSGDILFMGRVDDPTQQGG
jgi:serpin B